MKKSLIALAALTAFAGAASAQSSVTMYGRVDLSLGKAAGSTDRFLANGSGSRLGMKGVEDLGGGMSALFQIEHRFAADTGQVSSTASANSGPTPAPRFWHGLSTVALQGGFGKVTLGRNYTTSFLGSQLPADPWGLDTVAANGLVLGGVGTVRNDSSITYNMGTGGFDLGFQIAEATDTFNNSAKRPMNFNVGFKAGMFGVGVGHERPGAAGAKWTTANVAFDLGSVRPNVFFGSGNDAAGLKRRSWLIGAVAPMGSGELRASVGEHKVAGTTAFRQMGLGYHYSMSKRTTLYADVVRKTKTASGTGYDIGVKHNF